MRATSFRLLSMTAVLATAFCLASTAMAVTTFYYNPETGNVSIDTTNALNGGIYLYGLGVNPSRTDIRFIPENYIQLTSSTYDSRKSDLIGEASHTELMNGYYTVGDILPTGISEEDWLSFFTPHHLADYNPSIHLGFHLASAARESGPGYVRDEAEFVYGQPDREFDNRWDLVDPDELQWATAAKLTYYQDTGDLVMDTTGENGGFISMFIVQSDGQLLGENFSPWLPTAFYSNSSHVIGFSADAIEPGIYGFGQVLPAGLSDADLQAAITNANFISRAGFGGANFDFESESLDFTVALATNHVPESSGLALALLLTSAVIARRRV